MGEEVICHLVGPTLRDVIIIILMKTGKAQTGKAQIYRRMWSMITEQDVKDKPLLSLSTNIFLITGVRVTGGGTLLCDLNSLKGGIIKWFEITFGRLPRAIKLKMIEDDTQ